MKVSEAEKLICPFMDILEVRYEDMHNTGVEKNTMMCVTTKCMAWQVTKDWSQKKKVLPSGHSTYVNDKELEPQDCKGYCQRLR